MLFFSNKIIYLINEIFQEAALRTFHINDDCTKYCITVPTDDGKTLEKKFPFIIIIFFCV
jgi:hypothetical protein